MTACPGGALNRRRSAYRVLPTRGDVRCRIEGCVEPCDRPYTARVKVCSMHTKISQVQVEGVASRFCHKHNKFHGLDSFEGNGHTCSVWLARLREEYRDRSERKKRKAESSPGRGSAAASTGGATGTAAATSGEISNTAAEGVTSAPNADAYDMEWRGALNGEEGWARVVANVCSESWRIAGHRARGSLGRSPTVGSTSSLDQRENIPLPPHGSHQLETPSTREQDPDLFGDDFCHILEHFDDTDDHPHRGNANGSALLDTTIQQPLVEQAPLPNQQPYSLVSFWIKLHGFTPRDLPSGVYLRDMLTHWMQARPMALSSSVQPGCTLLKFDFLLPQVVAAEVRARGVSELASQVGEGPLGCRGDYAVGIDGDVARATETYRGGVVAARGEEFTITTSSTIAEDAPAISSSSVPVSVLGVGLQVVSDPCVCSTDRGEGEVTTVIVRLPHPLPDGGRIECRVRGRIIPLTLAELTSSPNGPGGIVAHFTVPPTGLNGAALLEMVHGDKTPCGVPAAVLIFATDALLVSTINAVRR